MQRLGQDDQARSFFLKSLVTRERLSAQEPDRVDFKVDLVVSLVRMGDRASLERALAALRRLDREGRLMPDKQQWIDMLEEKLGDPGHASPRS